MGDSLVNKIKSIFSLFLIFLIVSIIVYTAYLFYGVFQAAADSVKAAILAGIVALLSLIISRYLEQQRDTRTRLAAKKIEVYERFFGFFFAMLSNSKTGKTMSETEMLDFLMNFQRDLLFWGSDGVVKAWLNFRHATEPAALNSTDKSFSLASMIKCTANLMIEMRKDVGYRFTTINAVDFATMILRIETADEKRIIEEVSRTRSKT
jgi:hypothetical protein